MDFKTRKYYYNRCNPFKPLEPDDERNVDLDIWGKENGQQVRGVNWAEKLAREIVFADEPVCKLFTGLPGSGKTTELKRLAARLADPDAGNLFPILINAEEVIDLASPIDVTDIISAVVYSAESTVIEKSGGDAEKALEEGYLKRLWNWLKTTDVSFDKAEFTVPSAGKLVMEMKTRPTLRQQIRKAVAAHFSRFIKDAGEELELLQEKVIRDFGKEGIVIIFDSLEKLRGITSNWEEVLKSTERVFMGNAPYVRLPVHVLYTVPASLTTRMRGIDFLPMIKVRDKENHDYEPGFEAARELIRKRVPDDVLQEIFGPDFKEKTDTLIRSSGGYPREIVQMMQKVIAQTDYPVSDRAFERIIKEIANEYQEIVLGKTFDWLAKIAVSKQLIPENEDEQEIAARLLQNHAVLRYLNDELWFDVHPAIRKIPGVQAAIARLEAGQDSCDEGRTV